jgi:uncharacterized membrane protein (DUF485 family)
MDFESFLSSCHKHGEAIFGLVIGIVLILATIFLGIIHIIKAVKNQPSEITIETEDDTDY